MPLNRLTQGTSLQPFPVEIIGNVRVKIPSEFDVLYY